MPQRTHQQIGRASKKKGARRELELAHLLTDLLGISFRRGRQFDGSQGSPDILADALRGLVHIEVKGVERLNVKSAFTQSMEDAAVGNEIPTLAIKYSRYPWLFCLRVEDLPKFVEVMHKLIEENSDATNHNGGSCGSESETGVERVCESSASPVELQRPGKD